MTLDTNNLEDTICAIATANGIGSIAIVRVSGPDALKISSNLINNKKLKERVATLCSIFDKDKNLIDKAIVIYFKAPYSFTAEDIVEFQCHGGSAIASIILDTLLHFGVRLAQNGEFSKRAFLNGKIDLSQAEAIAKIIETKSDDAVKLLARQLKGELSNYVEEIRKDLIFIIANSEVSIDYAEEDLPQDILDNINSVLSKTLNSLYKTLENSKRREGLISGFKVAIIGEPNVGKSSLLNALLNYNRAIVSNIEGTTRDTIEENLKIGSHLIKIIDTAGIRDANNEIEKIGIDKTLEVIKEADIIIAMFDNSKKLENREILDILKSVKDKEIIYTINKIDLETKLDYSNFDNFIKISTKDNIEPLINRLKEILDNSNSEDEITLVSKRQIIAIKETIKELEESKKFLDTQELELFSFHINEAIKHISSITKPYEYDDMLDVMFGSFCLGK